MLYGSDFSNERYCYKACVPHQCHDFYYVIIYIALTGILKESVGIPKYLHCM